jgi:ketosteroid isomerase-like protein
VAQSADIAYSYGTYKLNFSGPAGNPTEDRGKYLEIWKKQKDGTWKCAVDTWNSDLPAK